MDASKGPFCSISSSSFIHAPSSAIAFKFLQHASAFSRLTDDRLPTNHGPVPLLLRSLSARLLCVSSMLIMHYIWVALLSRGGSISLSFEARHPATTTKLWSATQLEASNALIKHKLLSYGTSQQRTQNRIANG